VRKTKGKAMKRKELGYYILGNFLAVAAIVMFCIMVYENVYLNRCLSDWEGDSFPVYEGVCGSYFYRDTMTKARDGWTFHFDDGEWYYIRYYVCNQDNFPIDVIASNPDTPITIRTMPSTFLSYDNMIVSMELNGAELVPQDAVYDYVKDHKESTVFGYFVMIPFLLLFVPTNILLDIMLYREHQRRKKKKQKQEQKRRLQNEALRLQQAEVQPPDPAQQSRQEKQRRQNRSQKHKKRRKR
jgi:uncharacterized membrane protein